MLRDRMPGLLKEGRGAERGFTRTELVAVLGTLVVLAAVGLPALGVGMGVARGGAVGCLNNLRQLAIAWTLYAEDYGGSLVRNDSDIGSGTKNWVGGYVDYLGSPSSTNPIYLTNANYAALGPYVRRAELFRCPEDMSTVRQGGVALVRPRSYSMNAAVGYTMTTTWDWNPRYRTYRKLSDIVDPKPDRLWLLVEEHPDSINDGSFLVNMTSQPQAIRIVDFPAAFHAGSCGFAFADGHTELKKWEDTRTMPAIRGGFISLNVQSPSNPDIVWLMARTSSLLP